MESIVIDRIVDNIFYVLPLIHRKLLKIDLQSINPELNLSRLHMSVMGTLKKQTLPVSEIARRLLIPKPEMTRLISQLISAGIVERQSDTVDGRVINIALTGNGRKVLGKCREILKESLQYKLSDLKPEEIQELSLLLLRFRELGSKLKEPQ